MALTFSTGMTPINAADATTNWGAWRWNGSGAAPSPTLDNVTYREGSGAISCRIAGANADGGLLFDYYTANGNTYLNLTTAGNEVIAVWLLCTSVSAMLAATSGGAYILAQSSSETGNSAPTVYAKWYISGANVYPGGWVLFMVDTRKTASYTAGSPNLAQIRRIGVGIALIAAPPTLRSDNIYVDALWYGRPIYKVVGDGATTATWQDFITHSAGANNGLIEDVGGAVLLSCGLRIGDGAQAATTTFLDATNKVLVFKRRPYYQGGATQEGLNYADYYLLDGQGAAAQRTSITLGAVVGAGDTRQGLMGGMIRSSDPTNVTWKVDFATDKADLSAVKLYGVTIAGAKGGVLLDNNAGGTEATLCSCTIINSGEVSPGTTGNGAEILNSNIVDPLGGTAANRGLLLPATHRIKAVNFITTGSPATQHLLRIDASGTLDIIFDGLKWYGDYTSGTLWHGELSNASQATITAVLSNLSNPTTTEFDKTGHASSSITTSTSVALKMIVTDEAGDPVAEALAYIDDNDQTPFILNTTTDEFGVAQTSYTGASVNGSRWRVRKYGYKQFKQLVDIGSEDITLYVTLAVDPQQV